ncbi:tetratricopeptide repeat protein [Clostridium tetani]|uniref:tetratricopeptide repeat protein n=1 Tax=Clostridium tetani TaxID=1513 RepID=UPI0024A978D1|nr:FxLYD domain-containing protein [Clostridium tetani]
MLSSNSNKNKNEDTIIYKKEDLQISNENNQISPKDIIDTDTERNSFFSKNKLYFTIPIASAFIGFFVIGCTYIYENNLNKRILSSQSQAEALALSGDLDNALKIVEKLVVKRPNYASLQMNLEFLVKGKDFQKLLSKIENLKRQGKYTEALNGLSSLEKELENSTGPFWSTLKKQQISLKNSILIAQIKNDMTNKNTIDQLIPYYIKISQIESEESQTLLEKIKGEISNIAYTNADNYLKRKHFDEALKEIDKALQYDKDNEKLLSFKNIIQRKKEQFEIDEQNRIEQAINSAKEEEENKTDSVKSLSINGSFNEKGEFIVKGEIENIGTKSIYSIEVFYSILDSKGTVLKSNSTYVYPNYLKLKDKGTFEFIHNDLENASTVKIDKFTWLLE